MSQAKLADLHADRQRRRRITNSSAQAPYRRARPTAMVEAS